MEKIRLVVSGLTNSHTHSGNYLIILKEELGRRNLHLVIGPAEAQAIAVELENIKPQRPLTHDLFKTLCDSYNIEVVEVLIYNLVMGVYYAKLITKQGDQIIEFDCRSSDAIAMATRFNTPIYTLDFILKGESSSEKEEKASSAPAKAIGKAKPTESLADLEKQLQEALDQENYEKASELRDKINQINNDN